MSCFFMHLFVLYIREEVKEQLEKKKKGSRALADFEDRMNEVEMISAFQKSVDFQ